MNGAHDRYTFDNLSNQSCNKCGTEIKAWLRRGISRNEWLSKERRYGLRRDARYCSNACRQSAYRSRKAAV